MKPKNEIDIAKATPRPWSEVKGRVTGSDKSDVVVSLGISHGSVYQWPQAKANGEMILQAVNQFEALTKVAEAAKEMLTIVEVSNGGYPKETAPWNREIAAAKKALANLEAAKG